MCNLPIVRDFTDLNSTMTNPVVIENLKTLYKRVGKCLSKNSRQS
jgi:hypothetical protein